jgi:hypothetical protein
VRERDVYAIDRHVTDRGEAAAICAAVLEVLRPLLGTAQVDVYSDYSEQMPEPVKDAERRLTAAGGRRLKPPPDDRMGLVVSVGDPEWQDIETYASWSINVEIKGAEGEWLADFCDSGYSVVAALDTGEAEALRARIDSIAPVLPLSEINLRRRREKKEQRRRTLRRRFRLP